MSRVNFSSVFLTTGLLAGCAAPPDWPELVLNIERQSPEGGWVVENSMRLDVARKAK